MRSRSLSTILVAGLLVSASCAERGIVPPDLAPALATRQVWAGGSIVIRTTNPLGAATAFVVTLDDDTLPATIVDDHTIQLTAPQRNGTAQLTVRSPTGQLLLADAVTIHGFAEATGGPLLWGYPLPKAPNVPVVLVHGDTSLIELDLRFGTSVAFPRAIHDPRCTRGPGPTPSPARVILASPGPNIWPCSFAVWELYPLKKVQDSVPGSDRISAMFSSNRWLLGYHHQICLVPSMQFLNNQCRQHEEINGVRFSPDGTRAFIYGGYSRTNNMPVYSTATGDTAFTIRDSEQSQGASFTPSGDTMFVAAGGKIIALDPVTGARHREAILPVDPEDVLVDPQGPWLYVFGWTAGNMAHLVVLDRGSLAIVGHIQQQASSQLLETLDALCYSCDNRLFIDSPARTLYVLAIRYRSRDVATGRSSIGRFGLMSP